jgi:hypothetical protein
MSAPAALGAVIDLGYCLNLAERRSVRLVEAAFQHLEQSRSKQGIVLPINQGGRRTLDYQVIETLHQLRSQQGLHPFDSVIGYFSEGQPIYDGAELRHQNHLQICVRDPSKILGYFLPRAQN